MTLAEKINHDLENHLNHFLSDLPEKQAEIYRYAVLPPGKMFRAKLSWAVYADVNQIEKLQDIDTSTSPDNCFLASAIEVHHAYTLVHDDLPCMDDDDFRRGKHSTHKKYGEWPALLIGDGLLNLSYELIANCSDQNSPELFKLMTTKCGALGLINGQFEDLSYGDEAKSLEKIIKIHELKTARLLEVSLVGGLIATGDQSAEKRAQLEKLGLSLGIVFQFIDDLTELAEGDIDGHELMINPWPQFKEETLKVTMENLNLLNKSCEGFPLVKEIINEYLAKMKGIVSTNRTKIEERIDGLSLSPLMDILNI